MKNVIFSLVLLSTATMHASEGNGGGSGERNPEPPVINEKIEIFSWGETAAVATSVSSGIAAPIAAWHVHKLLSKTAHDNKGTWKGWVSDLIAPAATLGTWVGVKYLGYCVVNRLIKNDDREHLPMYLTISLTTDALTGTAHTAWKQYQDCHSVKTNSPLGTSPDIAQRMQKK